MQRNAVCCVALHSTKLYSKLKRKMDIFLHVIVLSSLTSRAAACHGRLTAIYWQWARVGQHGTAFESLSFIPTSSTSSSSSSVAAPTAPRCCRLLHGLHGMIIDPKSCSSAGSRITLTYYLILSASWDATLTYGLVQSIRIQIVVVHIDKLIGEVSLFSRVLSALSDVTLHAVWVLTCPVSAGSASTPAPPVKTELKYI